MSIVKDRVEDKVIKTYKHGVRLYDSNNENYGYNFITVVEGNYDFEYIVKFPNCVIYVYSEALFIKKIKNHELFALECIFQYKEDNYREYFKLNRDTLYVRVMIESFESYGRCYNYFKNKDKIKFKEELFNSIKSLGVGVQIALTGKIVNYESNAKFLNEIDKLGDSSWEKYFNLYKESCERMQNNFKRVTNEV